jgi:hypothetical protein
VERSSWFHASASAAERTAPSGRELRSQWRERLQSDDTERRQELQALAERLSREDLETVLAIARRLAEPPRA